MTIENKDYMCDLEDELIEMHVNLESKVLFHSKDLSEYWRNVNTVAKYPKLRAVAEPFLDAFPTSYTVEAGLSHVNASQANQKKRLNLRTVVTYD